ncbi:MULTISPECIES: ethanolamine permease [unclassified Haladaptatus]|uniref:ethanolamine permease n=1 Tax=unclassified Haladaptatus TaxID=2622732 RepID=UPI00209BF28C|nr:MULTISPECIES: ethanolamine permease [unclassified Haladaptatus]MCO8243448.1 ethanolamine permease [Haladaptatus sp. AB643]MCO8254857.1 ethanolamine permease [Haladaptatus sp. AB618]
MSDKEGGSVTYNDVDDSYFEDRGLRRHAKIWSLWALGVGAVISGDFFGWNFGLAAGGFMGLVIATVIIAVMYLGLCFSIAEMAPALPHTGGAYSFGRTAMGPWGGFITGLGENMEYIITTAVIVVGIGGYMNSVTQALLSFSMPAPVWWAIFYGIFVGLNIVGVKESFRFTVFITFLALGILAVFFIGAIPHFSFDWALNVPADSGQSKLLPKGIKGIFLALPFAIWFFLAIEELPLAAEEAHDPERDLPKATILGIVTLIITAFLTLFLNSGIAPGAAKVGQADNPLFLGFKTIFPGSVGAALLSLIAVAGLVASFHAIIFAFGRNIYSLSRAGYFPQWLSVTHDERDTPHVALIAGSLIGYVAALLIWLTPSDSPVGAVLLNMAVFGAMISYIMQSLAFILLRREYPNLRRPYRSPVGVFGAVVAIVIAAVTFVFLFLNPSYRFGVIGAALWYAGGIIYFAVRGRHRLVRAPEEDFALNQQNAATNDAAPDMAERRDSTGDTVREPSE